jgi:sugar/nucleoside kinase (ribokinase family)
MLKFPGINPVDYLIIGHISRDRTPEGYKLGGSVSYAGLTARALGSRVGIVTSWGEEQDAELFNRIAVANNLSEHSTTFENRYTPEGRVQLLHKLASELDFYHIPEAWRQAKIVHLAPIAQEVQPNIVRHFPNSHIYLTLQGWLRQWDSQGKVSPVEWPEANYVLQQAHAAVLSEEDVQGDQAMIEAFASSAPILVVTRAAAGANVYVEGRVHHIPAPQVDEVDPTGAGDIFAAAFFIHLTKFGDPLQAGEMAVRVAADSVTRSGLASAPTEDTIHNILSEVP